MRRDEIWEEWHNKRCEHCGTRCESCVQQMASISNAATQHQKQKSLSASERLHMCSASEHGRQKSFFRVIMKHPLSSTTEQQNIRSAHYPA